MASTEEEISSPLSTVDERADVSARARRKSAVIPLAFALVLALLAVLAWGLRKAQAGPLESGAAPDFSLTGFDGRKVTLSDLRGQVVVLNFWASWCDTCKEEMPLLEGAARGYRARGDRVVVLGVNVQDLPNNARGFLKEYAVSYPNLRDKGDTTKLRYEVGGLPETFIIDQRGRIAVKQVGQLTDIAQISTPVDQLLKERG